MSLLIFWLGMFIECHPPTRCFLSPLNSPVSNKAKYVFSYPRGKNSPRGLAFLESET